MEVSGHRSHQCPIVACLCVSVGWLLVAVLTRSPVGVAKSLPVSAHTTLDYVLAVVLVLAPFVLGFADDTSAVTFFVLLGVAHAALSTLTAFPHRSPADRA